MARIVATLALSVFLSFCAARSAHACWDGYSVRIGHIAFTGGSDHWDPEHARELALWARRLEVLLGPDGSLEVEGGYGEACADSRCVEMDEDVRSPRALFHAVARALAIPAARRATALRVTAAPYSVQVAATRDGAVAERLAERLSRGELPMGFFEAGGFPSDNPEAHVVKATAADGQTVFRVVVGAFIDRDEALAHVDEIAALTGLPTLLRAL